MGKKLLDIYTDYLITQNQFATTTGLSKLLDGVISHDQVARFLNKDDFSSKYLWQYVKPEIRKHEQKAGGALSLMILLRKSLIQMKTTLWLALFTYKGALCKRHKYPFWNDSLWRLCAPNNF